MSFYGHHFRQVAAAVCAPLLLCLLAAPPAFARGGGHGGGHAGGGHASSGHVSGSHSSGEGHASGGGHDSGSAHDTGSAHDSAPHDETVEHDGVSYGIHDNGDGTGTITAPGRIIPFHAGTSSARECDANGDGAYASSECPDGTTSDKSEAIMFLMAATLVLTVVLAGTGLFKLVSTLSGAVHHIGRHMQ